MTAPKSYRPAKCCPGCYYWRKLEPKLWACHYLLETDRRCGRVGDTCPVRTVRRGKGWIQRVSRKDCKDSGSGGI